MLAAWLLATGSHWDLVQTFGWGRMIANYSQTMSLAQAVRLTFTPDNMCGVCTIVADAKQSASDDALPGNNTPKKILLTCAPLALVFAGPASLCIGLLPERIAPPSAERAAPPTPPPNALA